MRILLYGKDNSPFKKLEEWPDPTLPPILSMTDIETGKVRVFVAIGNKDSLTAVYFEQ